MSDFPTVRPVEAFPVQHGGQSYICLRDPQQFSQPLIVTPTAYYVLSHFDGKHSPVDVQEAFCRRFGELLIGEDLKKLVNLLDQHFYLFNDRFIEHQTKIVEEFARLSFRPAAHAGSVYSKDPEELTKQLEGYFVSTEGPGKPNFTEKRRTPRAIAAPHIDFHRGGPCYAWAYRELLESPGADLYILLGTSHSGGRAPFIATLKDYETPWGPVETDKTFVEELKRCTGKDLFAEEVLHRTEHSLEFQVIFLAYVAQRRAEIFKGSKQFKIVPILVSSFHHMVQGQTLPEKDPEVGNFLNALKGLVEKEERAVCIIAGVDLAHVGMQFGDREPITPEFLRWVESEDRALLNRLVALDGPGFFREVAKDQDRRRICGFSPLYSLVNLMDGNRGNCLKYSQAFTSETGSAVTFASVTFD